VVEATGASVGRSSSSSLSRKRAVALPHAVPSWWENLKASCDCRSRFQKIGAHAACSVCCSRISKAKRAAVSSAVPNVCLNPSRCDHPTIQPKTSENCLFQLLAASFLPSLLSYSPHPEMRRERKQGGRKSGEGKGLR